MGLMEALSIARDVIFDISVEGNRPDAWSVEGVARDLAARLGRSLRSTALATPNVKTKSNTFAKALLDAPISAGVSRCRCCAVSRWRHRPRG